MNTNLEDCPSPSDIEPACFSLEAPKALSHARMVLEQTGLPKENLRVAVGLVIPNAANLEQILYGWRDPQYHSEYRDTWGLPSIGITPEDLLAAQDDSLAFGQIPQRVGERKLGGMVLEFDHVVGWTGRLRLVRQDSQFTSDYYLIMVDVRTKPVWPDALPEKTPAYTRLQWLTPQEHTALVVATPNRACGACSDLASLAARLGRI